MHASEGIHHGFETQARVSSCPTKRTYVLQIIFFTIYLRAGVHVGFQIESAAHVAFPTMGESSYK